MVVMECTGLMLYSHLVTVNGHQGVVVSLLRDHQKCVVAVTFEPVGQMIRCRRRKIVFAFAILFLLAMLTMQLLSINE
jgi:hypothetical protein